MSLLCLWAMRGEEEEAISYVAVAIFGQINRHETCLQSHIFILLTLLVWEDNLFSESFLVSFATFLSIVAILTFLLFLLFYTSKRLFLAFCTFLFN